MLGIRAGGGDRGPARAALGPNVLADQETEYYRVRVVRRDPPKCNLLEINEGLSFHSVWFDDGRIAPTIWGFLHPLPLLVPRDDATAKPRMRICIVGLCAGTVATQYQRRYDGEMDLAIDGVEIDPAVVELGRRFFALDERRLRVHIEDGRTFLARAEGKYELIIGDAYRQPYIPAHLVTREFLELALSRLEPGGILALNVGSLGPDTPVLLGIQNALVAAAGPGFSVERFEVKNDDVPFSNFVLMASDRAIGPRWEAIDRPELAAHRRIALQTWRTIESDPRGPLFTDDRAPVEWYTDWMVLRYAAGSR